VRHPLLAIYRGDERVATLLEPVAAAGRWRIARPYDLAECLQALPRAGPGVLVVRPGRDLEGEMTLVERVARLIPAVAIVVVCEADQASLVGLARDLGAAFVHFPPMPRDLLQEVVAGLMATDAPVQA
jgi:hypothetical protein